MNIFTYLPQTIQQALQDFESQFDSMFSSVMSSALTTSNFDLICYLNGKSKYEPWYSNIAYHCMVDRNYTTDNMTYWHNNFVAAIPAINQMYLDAIAAVAGRAGCGPNDVQAFNTTLGTNLSYATYAFSQLQMITSNTYGLVPYNMLYGFSSALQMIFSTATNNPSYDAVSAVEDVSKPSKLRTPDFKNYKIFSSI